MSSPGQLETTGTTPPFTAEKLEQITRRLQNLSLESRETANTGGFTALVTPTLQHRPSSPGLNYATVFLH
ncbi:uncharacterized protein N7529_002629 [Penicillium soppii]|uniref:uncharacterized protein n=1 Tax=Penicillium soppii TaxID=69789 RepID=UPI002547513B|nr:uncharacterized protein N7529_002629 [Penicillium soppii]KAJ5874199.1 hypothetical protein N7529_002629 [Penicillium soppii]